MKLSTIATLLFIPFFLIHSPYSANSQDSVDYSQPAADHFVEPLRTIDWEPATTIRTFFPAQANLQWLAGVDGYDHPVGSDGSMASHPGEVSVVSGNLSCQTCHGDDLEDGTFASNLVDTYKGVDGKETFVDVDIQAAFDDDYLYIRASWKTQRPRPGITHGTFQYINGQWERNTKNKTFDKATVDDLEGNEFFSYEDRFSVMLTPHSIGEEIKAFGNEGMTFNQAGCFVACHASMREMPERPSSEEVSDDPWLGSDELGRTDIRHYLLHTRDVNEFADATKDGNWKTDDVGYDQSQQIADFQNQNFIDLWQFRGARSAPMYGASNDAVLEYRHSGLAHTNRGDNYWFNQDPTADQPENVDELWYDDTDHHWKDANDDPVNVANYIWMYDEEITGFYAIPGDAIDDDVGELVLAWTIAYPLITRGPDRTAVPLDMDVIDEGDMLPRRILREGTGIRGALHTFSLWDPQDNTWTVTFRRPLNTTEACDHGDYGDWCSDLDIRAADLKSDGQGITMAFAIFDDHSSNRYHHVSLPVLVKDHDDADIKAKDNTVVSVEMTNGELPRKYTLDQNYPNPFNPITTINFAVREQGHAQLSVFNSIGQQVEILIDEVIQPGRYSVTWDASRMPSGVYYYRLSINDFEMTRRMLFIK